MNKDMVSVVIPTFNRGILISESIKSVLDQDYTNLEVIVVDDASDDDTEKIVRQIRDERVYYHKLNEHKGANYARNYGISMARGEYIAFNDSDDLWHKDNLSVHISKMVEAGAAISFCKKRTQKNNKWNIFPKGLNEGFVSKESIFYDSKVGTQCIVAKKECFERVRFDESMPRSQDFELVIRMAKEYPLLFIDEILVDCFYTNDSITSNAEAGVIGYQMLLKKHKDIADMYPEIKRRWLYSLAERKYLAKIDAREEYGEALRIRFSLVIFVKYVLTLTGLAYPVRRIISRLLNHQ